MAAENCRRHVKNSPCHCSSQMSHTGKIPLSQSMADIFHNLSAVLETSQPAAASKYAHKPLRLCGIALGTVWCTFTVLVSLGTNAHSAYYTVLGISRQPSTSTLYSISWPGYLSFCARRQVITCQLLKPGVFVSGIHHHGIRYGPNSIEDTVIKVSQVHHRIIVQHVISRTAHPQVVVVKKIIESAVAKIWEVEDIR